MELACGCEPRFVVQGHVPGAEIPIVAIFWNASYDDARWLATYSAPSLGVAMRCCLLLCLASVHSPRLIPQIRCATKTSHMNPASASS